jgi:hypothetical protein
MSREPPWYALETLLRRDPGRRGVAGFCYDDVPLGAGSLESAARSLALEGKAVAIVTGFCVVDASPPAAETDGPPGALYLARALVALGLEVAIISDSYGMPLLEAGCDLWRLPRSMLREIPFEEGGPESTARAINETAMNRRTDAWVRDFLTCDLGRRLTHLISIERVGPSHTLDSLARQTRSGPFPQSDFEREVPLNSRNVCHNMRGMAINGHTAKTHRLFEMAAEQPHKITTIGMADGGNELGMGSSPWEVLRQAIAFGPGGQIACRIPTDHTIVAGVSNWAAYALATSCAALRNRRDLLSGWDAERQRALIETLVREAGAVDGVTKLPQATVDGLPLETYLQALRGILEVVERGDWGA